MKKRGTETESQIHVRLKIAEAEIKEAHQKQRLFKYHVINDVFDNTVKELTTIIEEEIKP